MIHPVLLDAVVVEQDPATAEIIAARPEPSAALTLALGAYYRDTILSPDAGALDRLVKVLSDDKRVAALARARYAEITDRVTKRCIISKVHREALGKALEQIGATQ